MVSIDTLGWRLRNSGAQTSRPELYITSGFSGRWPLHQLQRKRAADAIAEEDELADAEVVHQPQLIVGESVPRIVDRHRARGFAASRIALIHGDAAEVGLEDLHCIDDRGRPTADP